MNPDNRPRIAGASIFFTVTLAEPGSDILLRHIDALRAAVRMTKAERPFHIRAMVILPDHLHAIWTLPKGDRDYATRWSVIEARFTQAVSEETPVAHGEGRGERGLWSGAYRHHHIRNEAEKRRLTQACWYDPVRHGLVEDPFDWPQSSIHRDAIPGVVFDADAGAGFRRAFDDRYGSDAPEGASYAS